MSTIHLSANDDFEAFYAGQKIADHPKKRAMSMLLTIIAGLLLYSGLKVQPFDEQYTYAGALTLVYIFFGRTWLFKIKVRNLWKMKKASNPELIIDSKGVEVKHQIPEQCKVIEWGDFSYYRIQDLWAFIYPKKNPEKFLVLSLRKSSSMERVELKSMLSENIKISQEQKSK
ncbi:MAG: hypothetical protein ABJF11_08480 [Reichenbachiella sp.]|uniref:hypothetical protein n=1 Tax=Reichenbachiella sp. TaxID=2184521 RepID=UPI003264187A